MFASVWHGQTKASAALVPVSPPSLHPSGAHGVQCPHGATTMSPAHGGRAPVLLILATGVTDEMRILEGNEPPQQLLAVGVPSWAVTPLKPLISRKTTLNSNLYLLNDFFNSLAVFSQGRGRTRPVISPLSHIITGLKIYSVAENKS